MAPRPQRNRAPVPLTDLSQHAYLQFPEDDPATSGYRRRLAIMSAREIEVAPTLDRDFLMACGLQTRLALHLVRTWTSDDHTHSFTCGGWDRLIPAGETIYRELTLEFYSMCTFGPTHQDPLHQRLYFRLGGVHRECSVGELAQRTNVYTREEMANPHFVPFLAACHTHLPDGVSHASVWAAISTCDYDPAKNRESRIRSPVHRLLHRIVALTVAHRRGGEKIPATDMFPLWGIINPTQFVHLPRLLADFMVNKGKGTRGASPLAGGHYITRLAESYEILMADVRGLLTSYRPRSMGAAFLVTMDIVTLVGDLYYIAADRAADVPEQMEAEMEGVEAPVIQPEDRAPRGQRRRREPSQAQRDQDLESLDVQATLRSLRAGQAEIRADIRLLMEGQRALFAYFGIPPLTGGSDGAGPSGTHHDSE